MGLKYFNTKHLPYLSIYALTLISCSNKYVTDYFMNTGWQIKKQNTGISTSPLDIKKLKHTSLFLKQVAQHLTHNVHLHKCTITLIRKLQL
jgi:hypothetical protein